MYSALEFDHMKKDMLQTEVLGAFMCILPTKNYINSLVLLNLCNNNSGYKIYLNYLYYC